MQAKIAFGIDPVVFHLFQRGTRPDLLSQSQELMVAGHQGQALFHRLQRPLLVPVVAAELGRLEPDPWIVRLLQCALFGIAGGLLQPSAVHQRHGIAVIPHAAAFCAALGGRHPAGRPVIVLVLVDIVAGKGVPEGDLQIGPGLALRKAALLHPGGDKLLQIPIVSSLKYPGQTITHLPPPSGSYPREKLYEYVFPRHKSSKMGGVSYSVF